MPYVNYVSNVALTANATDPVHSCTNSADFKTGWYKPDDLRTPIPIGTVQPGRYSIFPSQNQVGSDWYLQVNSSPLRVVSHVCAYFRDTLIGPYWDCAGTADNPFPR